MRKPVVLRIFGFLVLYCVVFAGLVVLQFTKKGNFSRRIGNMTISGQYAQPSENGGSAASGEQPESDGTAARLSGGAGVSFGGLEFSLRNKSEDDGFVISGMRNQRTLAAVESMEISGNTARFALSDGTSLVFETAGETPELRISAEFASRAAAVDIPVRLQRASLRREADGGNISITHNGVSYVFSRPVGLAENGVLTLRGDSPSIAYRVLPQLKAFNPADYIVANTQNTQFNDILARWNDQNFSYWNRNISSAVSEDMVTAYCGEAVSRNVYRDAVSAVPEAFLSSSQRSYNSSVFLGGMNAALRSFVRAEREKIDRISRLINEQSPDILRESHVFEFLLTRGLVNIAEEGLELIRSIEPSALIPEICPGIFEGYMDIRQWRPNGDNPFERLTGPACDVFSGGIRKDSEKDMALFFRGDSANIEYNLRLGKALWTWAGAAGEDDWAGLGRSLVLSVLLMKDGAGAVPVSARFSEADGAKISAAQMYHILGPGKYFPRAAKIGSGVSGLWAWTGALSVDAAQENNILDISVSFPVGETHYMMIRGIRPFSKIQIYNIDYPTDPQFERYDSSGWIYSAQEQILVLKMKHRSTVEHIKVFY